MNLAGLAGLGDALLRLLACLDPLDQGVGVDGRAHVRVSLAAVSSPPAWFVSDRGT